MLDTTTREEKINDARIYAESIVNTIRESLVVLDEELHVVSANASFYNTFKISEAETVGRRMYELGNGQWDIPRLRELLEKIIPKSSQFRDFEVEHNFPSIGHKAMLLNAQKIKQEGAGRGLILLAIEDITERRELEKAVFKAEQVARHRVEDAEEGKRILAAIMDNLPEGLVIVDGEGKIRLISTYMSQMTGLTQKDALGTPVEIFEDRLGQTATAPPTSGEYPIKRALHRGGKTHGEDRTIHSPNGEKLNIAINAAPIKNATGEIVGALAAWQDISERKRAEDILRRNEYELRTLVESSPDIIARLDRNMRYVFVNPTYEHIAGRSKEQFAGKTNEDLGMPRDQVAYWEEQVQSVFESGHEGSMEFEFSSIFGKRLFWGKIVPEFVKSGFVESVMIIARDITERKIAEEQIRYISFHDKVTALFNRAYFEEELKRLDTDRMLPLGIIMGDVNHLKLTNDTFGHREGDRLLKKIAELLRDSCRNEDIIARWGGDEFAVILPKTSETTAQAILERIKSACRQSEGTAIRPSLALGVAIKSVPDQNIYRIVRQAEELMYANKLGERRQNEELALSALLERVRENSYDRGRHTERLEKLADDFRQAVGLSDRQYDSLKLLVRFHDIGKATIPPEILMKPDLLSPEEWDIVKKYPEASYRASNTFSDTTHIADEVYSMREHWNGGGYPRRIREKEIPYLSRLLAIVDAYDVMTHERPYAKALTTAKAIEELQRNAGKQFDPELVEKFVKTMSIEAVPG
jgi:diguanylate cyclase (GGDEF)-like protein/PAS domain S-box-containing protein